VSQILGRRKPSRCLDKALSDDAEDVDHRLTLFLFHAGPEGLTRNLENSQGARQVDRRNQASCRGEYVQERLGAL